VGDLLRQLEVNKLARVLGVKPDAVSVFLASTPEDIQAFRLIVTGRLFSQNAKRATSLAQLSKKVPAPISAKVAEAAFGPVLSARIAGALDPVDAGKLASLLSPEFLARVARDIDPGRIAGLIQKLPEDLIVKVGHMLLADGDNIALSRFVASVSPDVALSVIAGADGAQLLELALYVDDRSAMDPIIARFSDERLSAVLAATDGFMGATEADIAEATIALATALSAETRARWLNFVDLAPPVVAKAVSAALAKIGA
jgi:hypothetical protein